MSSHLPSRYLDIKYDAARIYVACRGVLGSIRGEHIEAFVVFAIFFGVVGGFAYATGAFTTSVASKSEELKKKGYTVSTSGVAIKTDRRAVKQEELADKMQRKMQKTATSGALGFRAGAGVGDPDYMPDATRRPAKSTTANPKASKKAAAASPKVS